MRSSARSRSAAICRLGFRGAHPEARVSNAPPSQAQLDQAQEVLPMYTNRTFNHKMFSRKVVAELSIGALFAALSVLPACSIHANDKHDSKDGVAHVDIKSPLGDLHVSEEAEIRDAGLTIYPGAKPAPKDGSDDKKSANVNLSVPGFTLKVVAAEFTSDDAPDKIIASYNKELQKYGKPIQCHGGWAPRHGESPPAKEEG